MQKLIIDRGKPTYVDMTTEEETELISQREKDKLEHGRAILPALPTPDEIDKMGLDELRQVIKAIVTRLG